MSASAILAIGFFEFALCWLPCWDFLRAQASLLLRILQETVEKLHLDLDNSSTRCDLVFTMQIGRPGQGGDGQPFALRRRSRRCTGEMASCIQHFWAVTVYDGLSTYLRQRDTMYECKCSICYVFESGASMQIAFALCRRQAFRQERQQALPWQCCLGRRKGACQAATKPLWWPVCTCAWAIGVSL